jgi:drug/metabolite transporter (DMT)-like permease
MREHLVPGLIGGALSLIAYAIVLWAQSFGNIALVAALRETSVLFAGVIAVVLFKERQTRVQVVALGLAAAGIVLVKVA